MTTDTLEIPLIQFADLKEKYKQAINEWLEDKECDALNSILKNGIPPIVENDIGSFLEWAYMRVEVEDLPMEYALETKDAIWIVSGSNCLIWQFK